MKCFSESDECQVQFEVPEEVIYDPTDNQAVQRQALDSVEKYKVAKYLTDELRELLCFFGTVQFENYMY